MISSAKVEVPPVHPMPFVRLELAILTVLDGTFSVLLGKRSQAPHAGKWALPGGVLRIDLDTSLDAAAQRVGKERLGAPLPQVSQLLAVGGQQRDPRVPWALSVVYRGLIHSRDFDATPGKRLEALRWAPVEEAIADSKLAFDHAQLISRAVQATRDEFDRLDFAPGLVGESFTLSELQANSEAILGRPLDKSSFRRRIADRQCVVEMPGAMKTGAFRPAQLYRLAR